MNGMKYAILILAVMASIALAIPAGKARPDAADERKEQAAAPTEDAPEVPAVVRQAARPAPNANAAGDKPQEAPKNEDAAPPAAKDGEEQKQEKPADELSAESAENASEDKAEKDEAESAQVEELVGAPFSLFDAEGMQGDAPAAPAESVESAEQPAELAQSVESAEQKPVPVAEGEKKPEAEGEKESKAEGEKEPEAKDEKDSEAPVVVVVDDEDKKEAEPEPKQESEQSQFMSTIDMIIGHLNSLKRATRAIEILAHRK